MNLKIRKTLFKQTRKKEKKPQVDRSITSLLPIVDYDEIHGYYVCKDKSIIDIVQFVCKDLTTTNAQDIETDILHLTRHLRMYEDDVKIISINIPTDCREQIQYLNRKIDRCKNNVKKRFLEKKRDEEVWIEKNRLNKEFYYMIFASNPERYDENMKTLMTTLQQYNLIKVLDREKKDAVLYKLNNKNRRN